MLAQTGAYVLSVEADADHALPERNETNNGATQSVIVSAVGLPLLELALDRSAFAPDTDVTGTARIINAGSRFSGSLRLHVLDAGDGRIVDLGSVAIPALNFGAELVVPVRWVGGTSIAASYRIGAELVDQYAATIASRTATFDVLAVRDFALALAATPAVAAVDAAVSLRAHLHYRAGNAAVRNAVLTWARVFDGAGNNVHEHQQTLATLLPGYRMQATTSWQGQYARHLRCARRVARGHRVAGRRERQRRDCRGLPNPAARGRHLHRMSRPGWRDSPATAGFAATNHGTVAIELSSLRLRLLDDAALQVLATSEVGGSVAAGQALSGSLDATRAGIADRQLSGRAGITRLQAKRRGEHWLHAACPSSMATPDPGTRRMRVPGRCDQPIWHCASPISMAASIAPRSASTAPATVSLASAATGATAPASRSFRTVRTACWHARRMPPATSRHRSRAASRSTVRRPRSPSPESPMARCGPSR